MGRVLLLAMLFAQAAQAQNGYLVYPTGGAASGVTAADLDGDGLPDLVVANTGSNSLTLLLNHSGAGFSLLPALPVTAPQAVVAADLNGDGRIDLVVAGSGGITVALGKGDGSFQTPQTVSGIPNAIALQVADLNGDGFPDVAFTYVTGSFLLPTGAGMTVLPGKGDGTFGAGTTYSLGFTPWAVLTIGDFNQDGKPDIAAAVGQFLIVFLNDGKANFEALTSSGVWNFAPGIATADFNGDGKADLVISGQTVAQDNAAGGQGIISVLLGKGDGTFQPAPVITTPGIATMVAAADQNHDGHTDIVAGLRAVTFFAGNGDGTFAGGLPFGSSSGSGSVALADFTGSGSQGFAGADSSGNLVILPRAVWPAMNLANVSSAGFGLGPLAPGGLATMFGSQLVSQTATNSTGTPPILLGGAMVIVTGSDGKALPAQLYYVSASQVNYVILPGTVSGPATVTVTSNGIITATGKIQVAPVAPALFTVNSQNLAAAYITRVSQSGQQTLQMVYQTDSAGNVTPVPIDLSGSDTVYLTVFGTGIRNAGAGATAVATIGSTNAPVTYQGPQGSYVGLDQVNIQLPSSLAAAGAYTAILQLTINGQPSNSVTLTIQ